MRHELGLSIILAYASHTGKGRGLRSARFSGVALYAFTNVNQRYGVWIEATVR
jgi:hypothetical protein